MKPELLTRCTFALAALGFSAMTSHAAPPLDTLRKSNESLHRFVLDNGLVCLVKEDRSAPVCSVQIWVATGSIHEQEFLGGGLSHYLEHMLFKGTTNRGVGVVTREIDEAGGMINAYTSYDRTVYYCNLPSKNWRVGVDVLSDCVMNASLPADEWKREQDVIVREMAMGEDDPHRVLHKMLFSTAFREHPYRHPVIGYEEVFRAMSRDDLSNYLHRRYTPDHMLAIVVGDVAGAEVEATLRRTFAGFKRKASAPVVIPREPAQIAPRVARKTGAYNVARLGYAFHTVALNHADAPALDVLAAITGQGRSSRLYHDIKETRQLAHEIDAWSFTGKEAGMFGVSATYDPDKEPELTRAIDGQIESWCRGEFTKAEVAKAQRQVLVNELGGLQTMSGQAASYGNGEFYTGNPRYAEFYLEQVQTVTPDKLREVARRYLTVPNRSLVLLTPETTRATNAVSAAAAPGGDVRLRTLSNGIRLIVREDHRLPFVSFSAVMGGGLLSESGENNGITQLTADLLTRGTARHDAEEIARRFETLGASLAAFSGRNSFGLNAHCLTENTDEIFGLFAECLLKPSFPAAELDKQRVVQIANIREQHEKPMFVAQQALRETLFPDHPYRWDPNGSEASLGNIGRDDVAAHYARLASAGNLVLSVFGDIAADRAAALAEKFFAALPENGRPALTNAAPRPALPARVERAQQKQQAIVLIGFPGLDLRDPRNDALAVLQRAMSGLSSDMMMEIRDKRGLAYYGGAASMSGMQAGMFMLYCGTRPDVVPQVEQLMREQMTRATSQGLRDEEWKRAREQLIAEQAMDLQDNGGLAQSCAINELLGLGYLHEFERPARLQELTAEQIRGIAAALMQPAREAVAIALPEKK